jgi:hypothetical protein
MRYSLLTTFLAITTQNTFCSQNPQDNAQNAQPNVNQSSAPKETHQEKMNAFEESKLEEKLNTYKRNNQMLYQMGSNVGHQMTKGIIQFGVTTVSQSIVEIVKKELDIRYDNSPTIRTQLEEIAGGIKIVAEGVVLTEDLAKKRNTLEIYMLKDKAEKEKRQKEIELQTKNAYEELWHLRNEHIDQLNAIRKKRNPNFVPYSAK